MSLVELPFGGFSQRRVHGAPQGLDDGVGARGRLGPHGARRNHSARDGSGAARINKEER